MMSAAAEDGKACDDLLVISEEGELLLSDLDRTSTVLF